MKQYDFIAIGDTVTDAFIRLENPSAHLDIDKGAKEICMRFADKIPYKDVTVVPAVGNSANAAVAASRLDLKSALVSNIGDDYFGKECLDALKKENVGAEFMKMHAGAKTNYHYVLWYEDDRTILIKHESYPYSLPDFDDPKWVYFSSLGGNSEEFHKTVENYLMAHPDIKLAFQPGTFQIKMGKEKIAKIYQRTEVFICNKEEAQIILEAKEKDLKKLMAGLHQLGPKIVVVTDGPAGAYASDIASAWFMPPYPDPKPPFERTGAGDAFSSTLVAYLAKGMSLTDSLKRAPINSMSVVQYVGAREGLLSADQIEDYIKKAPPDYEPKKI
ncbi:MAG: carbohydrate kinase family protein [Candidatus Giovannonibacteria bacterium]|nr:carbohydrate kinase family protein [Candidatus Giovannonibacteria bacterium]